MTRLEKYNSEMLGWRREPGPLKVWRVVDGREKNENGNSLRFSIQEIPEDRYEDVLELMCTIFLRDESICESSHILENPTAIDDFRKLWSFGLHQGITVGAFLVDDNNSKTTLAGVNMTLVNSEATEKALKAAIEFQADKTKKILGLLHDLETKKNPMEIYKVDKYITAFGLCVDPRYRGQGLGLELLKARDDMAVGYDIHASSTIFTSAAAQRLALKAGFELLIEFIFAEAKNEDGTEMFPAIKSKSAKLMGKKFQH